uniref:Amino acid transporter n=1 Tax=Peronospora matthiolae TaxID=2874970 RepID=A0AAV1U062_9STRA
MDGPSNRRPPAPTVVLLEKEQQQKLREGHADQSNRCSDDQQRLHPGPTSDRLALPSMLPSSQHVALQAPPPPTTSYLRTDFTTGRRPLSTTAASFHKTSEERGGDGLQTNVSTNRQNPNPVAAFLKAKDARENFASGNSLSAPTDYDNVEHTAMPFISSADCPVEQRPDPTKGFRGNGSNLKLSVRYMLIGAIFGIALGIVFTYIGMSPIAAQWISLPGDLFLRAVNALVVPYVFCSVAVAVGDIVFVGKVSIVGLQTLKVFAVGWLVSTILGISVALVLRPFFRLKTKFAMPSANAVGLTCSNGQMVQMLSNNSIVCSSDATELSLNNAFVLTDMNKVFVTNSDAVITDLTLRKQLISTLESVVPNNIFAALAEGNLLSIIVFAAVLGSVAGRSYFSNSCRVNYLYLVLLQLRNTFFLAMEWVIWITPVAVVSIISGAFASSQDAVSQMPKVYMFLVACILATALQILVVYPLVIFLLTRCNPYVHMRHMVRSYLFAFGSSSSLASAPVTLSCIQKARVCSQSIATFVVSIGAVTNMSGSGWYFPIGIIFLAESSGNGDELNFLRLVAIFFLTLVACACAPPVPNGGMVLMSTMYKTVFGVSLLPSTWALYVAMDFLADRLASICNVNDEIMALKVIAEITDETVAGDQLSQRN